MNSPGLHLRPLILVRTSESCAKNWCVFMVWTVCVEHLGPAGGFLFGVRLTIQTYIYIYNYIGRMFNWISIMYQTKWLTLFGDPQLLQGAFKVLLHQWLSVGPWLPRSFWKASFHWTGPQQKKQSLMKQMKQEFWIWNVNLRIYHSIYPQCYHVDSQVTVTHHCLIPVACAFQLG